MAAHGHGMAGSDDATASRFLTVTLRAPVVLLWPKASQRREWEDARSTGCEKRYSGEVRQGGGGEKIGDWPIPMHDQLANTVEKEEGITAGLWVSWATRFCQNAGARRGRSSGGNGGGFGLRCGRREKQLGLATRSGRCGWLQDVAGHARVPTARVQRAQASDDEWRHVASGFWTGRPWRSLTVFWKQRFRFIDDDWQRHFNTISWLIRCSFVKTVFMKIVDVPTSYIFFSRTKP